MNLHDYFYDHVSFEIGFESGEFDKATFLADIKPKKEVRHYRFACASKEHKSKQHAHVNVELLPHDNEVRVQLLYTISKADPSVKETHSMEDCARWISRYFKISKVVAFVEAEFRFDKHYIPVVPLPFPLTTNNEELVGCSVTGMALEFPEDADLDSAIIQTYEDTTMLTAWGFMLLTTNRFDLQAAMKKFAKYGKRLMRKVAITDERKTTSR